MTTHPGAERVALEAALTEAYRKGVVDGLKYGPVVSHWDYPPLHARALLSQSSYQRGAREMREEAAKVCDEFNNKYNVGHPGLIDAIARLIRSLPLQAPEGEKKP